MMFETNIKAITYISDYFLGIDSEKVVLGHGWWTLLVLWKHIAKLFAGRSG